MKYHKIPLTVNQKVTDYMYLKYRGKFFDEKVLKELSHIREKVIIQHIFTLVGILLLTFALTLCMQIILHYFSAFLAVRMEGRGSLSLALLCISISIPLFLILSHFIHPSSFSFHLL